MVLISLHINSCLILQLLKCIPKINIILVIFTQQFIYEGLKLHNHFDNRNILNMVLTKYWPFWQKSQHIFVFSLILIMNCISRVQNTRFNVEHIESKNVQQTNTLWNPKRTYWLICLSYLIYDKKVELPQKFHPLTMPSLFHFTLALQLLQWLSINVDYGLFSHEIVLSIYYLLNYNKQILIISRVYQHYRKEKL